MKILAVVKIKLDELRLIRKRQSQSLAIMYILFGIMIKIPQTIIQKYYFKSSNDGGITFADKINLSNTTTTDSINTEIAADGNNVIITWWERNSTSQEPMVRASTDNGATFGPILRLTSNETVGS